MNEYIHQSFLLIFLCKWVSLFTSVQFRVEANLFKSLSRAYQVAVKFIFIWMLWHSNFLRILLITFPVMFCTLKLSFNLCDNGWLPLFFTMILNVIVIHVYLLGSSGATKNSVETFLPHRIEIFCRGTFLRFRKFPLPKNFLDKKGGITIFRQDFLSHRPKNFVGKPFCVSEKI